MVKEALTKNYVVFIMCIPPLTCTTVAVIKYTSASIKTKKIRTIFESIKSDWNKLMNLPEGQIMCKQAMEGRKFTIYLTFVIITATVIYMLLSIVLITQDSKNMKNNSEPRVMLFNVEFFVDQQKHYYSFNIYFCLMSMNVVFVILTIDTLYIVLAEHACVLLAVIGYRLKTVHVLNVNTVCTDEDIQTACDRVFSKEEHEQIYQKFKLCITEHIRALEYMNQVQELFSISLFLHVTLTVIAISSTAVLILLRSSSTEDMIRLVMWLTGQLTFLYSICVPGQRFMNYSEKVHYCAIECMWYICNSKTQTIYRYFLMNTLTPRCLVACKLITLSMDTFLSIVRLTMSYFTLMSSSL